MRCFRSCGVVQVVLNQWVSFLGMFHVEHSPVFRLRRSPPLPTLLARLASPTLQCPLASHYAAVSSHNGPSFQGAIPNGSTVLPLGPGLPAFMRTERWPGCGANPSS